MPFLNPNADASALDERLDPATRGKVRHRLVEHMSRMPASVKTVDEGMLYNRLRLDGIPGVSAGQLARLTVADVQSLLVEAGFKREE